MYKVTHQIIFFENPVVKAGDSSTQVHSVVMVRGGRRREIIGAPAMSAVVKRAAMFSLPGCNYTCMRGQYDLLPVKNRGSQAESLLLCYHQHSKTYNWYK